MKKWILFISALLVVCSSINAQIANGSWRDHLAYHRAINLAKTSNKVFCGFKGSGILSYDKNSGEIEKISKATSLTDIDISYIKYSETKEILIIGYQNGNIDLITHEDIINMPDILRKSMTSSKRINSIECTKNLSYLACDFGIVVLDLDKMEIKDTYLFGPNGSSLLVYDLALTNEEIFAATEFGLYKASLSGSNLLDFSSWDLITDVPEPGAPFENVEYFADKLIASYKSKLNGYHQVLLMEKEGWTNWNIHSDTTINNIDAKENLLSISGSTYSILVNQQFMVQHEVDHPYGTDILLDESGRIYLSGKDGFSFMDGSEKGYIAVNGPRFNTTGKVSAKEGQVWVTSGGPFRPFTQGGGYNFSNEKWTSINAGWNPGLDNVGNLYKIAYHPNDPNHIFASSYLYGLYEIKNFEVINNYTWENTDLFRSTIDKVVGVRIMGLDFDSKGNLWAIFDETNQPVYRLGTNGEWVNIELKSGIFSQNGNFADLIVTSNDQIWILSKKEGVVVLKENDDGSISENQFPLRNFDGENLSYGYCLVEDKEERIWIGTNRGPIIYSPTPDILSSKNILGNQVRIPRDDGTGLADFLLDYEVINDIAVDGGNRKWLATEKSGVFLVSEDGKKTYHHFTKEDYPLFSNNIIGIGVHEKTGEVIISTNLGIIGFMGTSTEGSSDFSDVFVYPNPIRPEFDGDITIRGLMYNSIVKITDISGNLVFEAVSFGGQAVWDGKDFNGQRVNTGVYLVFLSNEDATKTHVTKLLFIH